jgi:hypothetical protein
LFDLDNNVTLDPDYLRIFLVFGSFAESMSEFT